jgi:hypothetical protein
MFAVVKTKTDDKHGWLAAGHSIGRLQLQARDLALGWTVKLAPLRSPRLRAQLRPEFGHKGFVQAIVCFDFHPLQPTASPLEAGRSTSLAIGARTQV